MKSLCTALFVIAAFTTAPLLTEAHASTGSGSAAMMQTPAPSYQAIGFMQQQFSWEQDSNDPVAFSIHRARVGLTGSVTDLISANIVVGALEPPNRTPRLVNGFLDFDIHPMFQLRTGQFLVPFGLEGPQPIFLNPAIERTLTVQRLNTFAMFRDIGIQASGQQEGISYAIALINGTGANNPANIDPKELAGRFGYQANQEIDLGLSFHIGQFESQGTEFDRFRFGIDLTYDLSPVLLRSEYIYRKDERIGENDLDQHGGYILGGYDLNEELQAILRFELHQPNTDADFSDAGFTALTTGLNYYFSGNNRVSVNYELRNDRRGFADPGDLFTVQMQVTL